MIHCLIYLIKYIVLLYILCSISHLRIHFCSFPMLFKTISCWEYKNGHLELPSWLQFALVLCLFWWFIYSFISAHFHFITQYVPHDTYVSNCVIMTSVVKHHFSYIFCVLLLGIYCVLHQQFSILCYIVASRRTHCDFITTIATPLYY